MYSSAYFTIYHISYNKMRVVERDLIADHHCTMAHWTSRHRFLKCFTVPKDNKMLHSRIDRSAVAISKVHCVLIYGKMNPFVGTQACPYIKASPGCSGKLARWCRWCNKELLTDCSLVWYSLIKYNEIHVHVISRTSHIKAGVPGTEI